LCLCWAAVRISEKTLLSNTTFTVLWYLIVMCVAHNCMSCLLYSIYVLLGIMMNNQMLFLFCIFCKYTWRKGKSCWLSTEVFLFLYNKLTWCTIFSLYCITMPLHVLGQVYNVADGTCFILSWLSAGLDEKELQLIIQDAQSTKHEICFYFILQHLKKEGNLKQASPFLFL
jgi:hypothetical protein